MQIVETKLLDTRLKTLVVELWNKEYPSSLFTVQFLILILT